MRTTPTAKLTTKAKRYARTWRIALCGPRNSDDEIPLEPHSVEHRLEKAWLAGFKQGFRKKDAEGPPKEVISALESAGCQCECLTHGYGCGVAGATCKLKAPCERCKLLAKYRLNK